MISVVIALYNEEEIIEMLYRLTVEVLLEIGEDYEIICIDDGSTDTTLKKLLNYHSVNKKFKILQLSRNFGHQAAFTAGLVYAKGDYIVMMDGDLQDPPGLIKQMYEKLVNEKLDIVYCKRNKRGEPLVKKIPINLFHIIFNKLSNISSPKNTGNFSIMNRKALDAFLTLKEKTRYLPGLRFFIGFNQGFIEFSRPDRAMGKNKMNFKRLMNLALDAIFSFTNLPIRFLTMIGLLGTTISILAGFYVLIKKILGLAILGWTSILLSIYFLGSIQLLVLGIIGEYIYRIYVEVQNRPIFIVKNVYD